MYRPPPSTKKEKKNRVEGKREINKGVYLINEQQMYV
jgi:hypothetical protein